MKRIYITLGRRVEIEGQNKKDSGDLVVVDWDSKNIEYISLIGRYEVENGKSRGCSGLDFFEDKLFVASRTDLIALNPDTLKEDYRVNLTPPYGVHQIKAHNDILWVACMRRNVKQAVKNGRVIDVVPTRYSGIDSNNKPSGCFNSIAWSPNEDEYHMYTGPEEIYNFSKKEIVTKGKLGTSPHDLCFLNNRELLFTRSIARELVLLDIETKKMDVVFSLPVENNIDDWGFVGFMRGIEYDFISDSVFIMTGPGTLWQLSRKDWNVIDKLVFYEGATERQKKERCPFDILLDPRDWRA